MKERSFATDAVTGEVSHFTSEVVLIWLLRTLVKDQKSYIPCSPECTLGVLGLRILKQM